MTARVAFLGTPAAAVPTLVRLNGLGMVDLVVTRPDKPRGRSGTPQPSDVKRAAAGAGIPVVTPARAEDISDMLKGFDLAVVVAYGQILPGSMLTIPRRGFVNVHFSRLPRWRGAAPVARAILAGDDQTGVDIIQLDEGMDTGPLLARVAVDIGATDTTGSLTERLAEMGADLLVQVIPSLLDGSIEAVPQRADGASRAVKLSSAEARLDPQSQSTAEVDRHVRAFNPKPGAWGTVDGERLKIWAVAATPEDPAPPATIRLVDGRPILGTADGSVELVEVQPGGKSPMAGDVWARGQRGPLVWE
ncbi:MAG: methionyl-tRNA formyltransferase [Acidimicrobiia bacterium]|nr:methionyl-tRNA formyltransferase [Acidimicrobiia bacterium]